MAIFRVQHNQNYTVMSNYHFREKEMSLKAKGLLSLMLSLPDTWDYSLAGLTAICKENETAIRSALKELEDFGYLRIDKKYPNETETGRIEYIYNVFEKPQQGDKKQDLENLYVETQYVENQRQLNTNKSSIFNSKELNNTNNILDNQIISKKPKRKTKKEKYVDKVLAKMEEYSFSDRVKEKLLAFYEDRIEKGDYPADNQLELSLNTLANVSETKQLDAINKSISAGYRTFYIDSKKNIYTRNNGKNLKDDYSCIETDAEHKARVKEEYEKALNGEDGYHLY